jgi:hypothetical protein
MCLQTNEQQHKMVLCCQESCSPLLGTLTVSFCHTEMDRTFFNDAPFSTMFTEMKRKRRARAQTAEQRKLRATKITRIAQQHLFNDVHLQ